MEDLGISDIDTLPVCRVTHPARRGARPPLAPISAYVYMRSEW